MNISKKVIFIFIALLCVCLAIYAEIVGKVQIATSKTTLEEGEEVALTVKINCVSIEGNDMVTTSKVDYDHETLEYVGVEAVSNRRVEASMFENTGYVFSDGEICSGEKSVLFVIKFRVKKGCTATKTKVTFSEMIATDGGEKVVYTDFGNETVTLNIKHKEEVKPSPKVTPTPEVVETPSACPSPEVIPSPKVSPTPEIEPSPEVSPSPEIEPSPEESPTPEVVLSPEVTPTPEVVPSPEEKSTPNEKADEIEIAKPQLQAKKMPSTIVTGANRSRLSAIIALSVLAVIAFLILAIKHIKQ